MGVERMKKSKTYIHVNQHVVKSNLKHGLNEPAITVKTGKNNTYCHEVKVKGEVEFIQATNGKPILSCGARIVAVTYGDVETVTHNELLI